jgi:hypothetical protein
LCRDEISFNGQVSKKKDSGKQLWISGIVLRLTENKRMVCYMNNDVPAVARGCLKGIGLPAAWQAKFLPISFL